MLLSSPNFLTFHCYVYYLAYLICLIVISCCCQGFPRRTAEQNPDFLTVIYSTFAVRTDDLCDHQAFFVTEAYLRPDGIVLASLPAQIHSLNRSSAARSGRCSQVLGTSPNQQIGGRQCSGAESFLLRSGADLASESSNSGSDTERFSQWKMVVYLLTLTSGL
jgi:hypothetical protein